ncbi:PaaI family thioesterase [Kallotenue papyrolyticum]|uniref:PaaI family thioesterase n=1 Tax=Kallotenue papyrolyticum TaxID=1325125 RepID=UPI0004785A55|nr:PaaI family thioesterase [Kallotenue papyrolyticum]
MASKQPMDDSWAERTRAGFAQQALMRTIGATLTHVAPGEVEIALPSRADLTQQHGYLHAGIITAIVDSACGFAAYTLMPAAAEVLTVEYKVNFIAPAQGERFVARGRVVKAGRTLTVCAGEVQAIRGTRQRLIAVMQATMIAVTARGAEA